MGFAVIVFHYRAARPDGGRVTGVVEAATASAAVAVLADRGLLPLVVREEVAGSLQRSLAPGILAPAFAGLAALLDVGLPADRALAAAAEGASGPVAELLRGTLKLVREGVSLSKALQRTGGAPPMVIGVLSAGEAHGRIAGAARLAASELERQAELRAQLRAALTYPLFLLVTGGLSLVFIVRFVVPRFAALLGDVGQTLPPATHALLTIADLLRVHGMALLALVLGVSLVGASALRTPEIRARLHAVLLTWPMTGSIRMSLATARVCRGLATMLESGVPLMAALDLASRAAADEEIARRMVLVRHDVGEGSSVGAALGRHRAITSAALQLVRFGEEAGRVPEFLAQAARLDDGSAQRSLQRLVAILEPLLIVSFGAVVAFVAAALLQAVYSVRPGS